MNLINFFMGSSPELALQSDYIQFSIDTCFLFYSKTSGDALNSFIESFRSKIKLDRFYQYEIDIFFHDFNTILKNSSKKKSPNETSFTFYTKEIQFVPQNLKIENSLIINFKHLIELLCDYAQKNTENDIPHTIVDLTNCTSELLSFIYFILINNCQTESCSIFNVIIRNLKLQDYFSLPLRLLDPTSLTVLDLITEDYNTIKDLQDIYSKFKKSEKVVSQPFISKYISMLSKDSLISEEWIEGIKHFYLTDKGVLYTHSKEHIQQKIRKDVIDYKEINYTEISTTELIQKAINYHINKDLQNINKVFDQLNKRKDISVENVITLVQKIDSLQNEKVHQFLENANLHFPNNENILFFLAKSYIDLKNPHKGLELLKQIIKINPDNAMAWELISKNLAY